MKDKEVKYTFKANAVLVVRMYFEHSYSAENICLNLRYNIDEVKRIIERHKIENGLAQFNG